jgi:hypothetical protein
MLDSPATPSRDDETLVQDETPKSPEESLPVVAILPHRAVPGLASLAGTAEPALFLPFREAFSSTHNTDAHAVGYIVADAEGNALLNAPRLNKSVLPELRENGHEVYVTWIAIDLDNLGHEPWTAESYAAFTEALGPILQSFPLGMEWTVFHTSRAGVRFVYVLAEPVVADVAEDIVRALVAEFQAAGLPCDDLHDWTRLYRLPYVLRDTVRQGLRDFDEVIWQSEKRLTLEPVAGSKLATTPHAPALTEPLPSDTIMSLLELTSPTGKVTRSAWASEARRRLKGRACFDCLFEGRPIASAGARDNTIHKYVGEVCALLAYFDGTTAEHVYALFLQPILKLEPDEKTQDWRIPLWRAICQYWPREVAKRQAAAQEVKVREAVTWQGVIAGMKRWCKAPEIHTGDEAAARDYISRRAIVSAGNDYFLLQPDGKYDTRPVPKEHIIARIRSLDMEAVIPTGEMAGQGISDKSIQSMLNQYMISGYGIEGVVDQRNGTTDDNAQVIYRTLFQRKPDLEPCYSAHVDAWLRAFAGEQYDNLCKWIGLALAFDEGPICALSIKGPPACGKKLLVQGLAECVTGETYSDAQEFGNFQCGIMHSPFLVINEGFPRSQDSPADKFRHFVSGDPIRVRVLYRAPVTVRNPLRLIFTLNNDDVTRMLAGGRDLTDFDRRALAQRLFHVDVPEDAVKHLESRGGMLHTAGWIRSDAGGVSKYTIARHFLWLYSKRPATSAGRFLMEGVNNDKMVRSMTLRSGASPQILEIILRLIQITGRNPICAAIEKDKIFVTEALIEEYDRKLNGNTKPPSAHTIRTVLAALRTPGTEPQKCVKRTAPNTGTYALWHELNLPLILDEAVERGLPCSKLQQVMGFSFPDDKTERQSSDPLNDELQRQRRL